MSKLRMLVLDEADQMCKKKGNEKAFGQLKKIVKHIPMDYSEDDQPQVQISAFSATFCEDSENYIFNKLMQEQNCNVFRISSDIPDRSITEIDDSETGIYNSIIKYRA